MLDADSYQQIKKEKAAEGDTWAKGDLFEKRTAEMFPDKYFSIVQYTPRREDIPGRKCENAKNPDFLFRDRKTKETFWVECKFRSYCIKGKIKICEQWRLYQYKKIKEETKIPLFFVIGIGEDPSRPEQVVLMEIDKIQYGSTFWSILNKHKLVRFSFTSLEETKMISENGFK